MAGAQQLPMLPGVIFICTGCQLLHEKVNVVNNWISVAPLKEQIKDLIKVANILHYSGYNKVVDITKTCLRILKPETEFLKLTFLRQFKP